LRFRARSLRAKPQTAVHFFFGGTIASLPAFQMSTGSVFF
jgi:hypothetical protein